MNETPLTRLVAEDEETRRKRGTLHTPAEILQQPWLWAETMGRIPALRPRVEAMVRESEFVLLSGAGSSLYAARMVRDALPLQATGAISATDLMLAPQVHVPADQGGILLSLSRSGESPEVVQAARVVAQRYPQVSHVAVTCNPDGALAKLVGAQSGGVCVVLHDKAYDRGMAMTSSVTSMVLAGRLLLDKTLDARVAGLAVAGEEVLGHASAADSIAASDPERVALLGTGPLEAAAEEGALKILEMTDGQVAPMARSFLEFRHGPLSFLDRKTVVVALLSDDANVRRYEMDLIREVRRSGAAREVVAFTTSGNPELIAAEVDRCISVRPVAGMKPGEGAILAVVFSQMLALFLTLRKGLTPDLPGTRGLINRIVKGVTIY